MAQALSPALPSERRMGADVAFAVGIVAILTMLVLPVPSVLIDVGLAFSIALSALILMVALWIQRPLDFSAFPTVLLIATILRLALNVATTRVILSRGAEGEHAAGYVVAGFSKFVMGGDFVIGLIIFAILVTVNFVVITKGATRIAEVGARFTLDAIPGKQMAIDADLSAGLIDDKEAQRRRRELEEESAFFGAMDGASKFVRGDAIAGLIITAINIFGGIVIGVVHHGLPLARAADIFTKLSVGDGLVSQIPALIVSLSAGLLVSKGGTRGSAEQTVLRQLGGYPRAQSVAALMMFVLGMLPGLPLLPFAFLGGVMAFMSYALPRRQAARRQQEEVLAAQERERSQADSKESIKEYLKTADVELCVGSQLAVQMLHAHGELSHRVSKIRRRFATQYGFVIPEIKLTDDMSVGPKSYRIKIHGTIVAQHELRIGEVLVLFDGVRKPDVPGDETVEPAFGMKAMWIPATFLEEVRRDGFKVADNISVLLTHLSEIIRGNLAQLLSYKDMRALLDRLDPEYKRLIEDICPSQISYSGLQAVLKLLLAERISIRNLHLILEAVAEIAPFIRRAEHIAEHVRMRIAQQICGDFADNGVLKVLRLGNRWDLAFHQSLKRDAKGEIVEFDADPRLVEQFAADVTTAVRKAMGQGESVVLVAPPEVRPYVRMITERVFPTLPVLSHVEIARGVEVKSLGAIS
ncbi:flagellar biosynthesis protein FlhA [Bradyrhizobium neotropicale]|uniref:flagellar biosynthesis protein FlhA n=1 Tax=Bradyrhizobium neotropicale TaxID=1497615 RepID=UPI001AD69585|nr:flagellar biosynthesis protein FlhA [Bradyrhizobium neotropicale]MBO4223994.1 flagellar biosynthesis protein FlhA [Bradyrhizobium neotropicale]